MTARTIERIKLELTNGKLHEFKLGPGPCGYTASELRIEQEANTLRIFLWIEEHEHFAEFVYPWHTVALLRAYPYPEAQVCAVKEN